MKTFLSLVLAPWCFAAAAWSQIPAAKSPVTPDADYVVVAGEALPHPVLVAYKADLTVQWTITAAGYFNEFASARFVYLIRNGKKEKISLQSLRTDPSKEPTLQPWDILYFPPALF